MSEEMAVGDSVTGEEGKINGDEATSARGADLEPAAVEPPIDPAVQQTAEPLPLAEEAPMTEPVAEVEPGEPGTPDPTPEDEDEKRGLKRRASTAFSDNGEEFRGFDDGLPVEEDFKGFDEVQDKKDLEEYNRVLERLQAEVIAARQNFTPVRTVMATPPPPVRASKRPRQDTDGSRPSSALSSRSDGDGTILNEVVASSPANRGRRSTTEISSPLLRVPLERGWKRELVYRAALDAHSRRNADIYYYTPQGKKLRSTREVSEHLSGTGLTLENFSFFKEPLGMDDPEKEIIRDAKMQQRRVESPVSSPGPLLTEGKRQPKPKPPKGASPEPVIIKSPPSKIRVKSVGSRLSITAPLLAAAKAKKATNSTDNNNTAAWKKARQQAPAPPALPPQQALQAQQTPQAQQAPQPQQAPQAQQVQQTTPPPPPPPLQSRPQPSPQPAGPAHGHTTPDIKSPQQAVQPCSLTCGRGVPSLACAACLCLYHPGCAGYQHSLPPDTYFCKNCRKSSSPPPLEPPPLVHKSGVTAAVPTSPPVPRRVPVTKPRPDKRVLLRMKMAGDRPKDERVYTAAKPLPKPKPQFPAASPTSFFPEANVAGGGPDGERVWAVSKPQPQPQPKPQLQPQPQPQPQRIVSATPPAAPPPSPAIWMDTPPPPPPRWIATPPPPRWSDTPSPPPPPKLVAFRSTLPQSLAVLNGKRFIVVPRSIVQPSPRHEDKRRGRIANGAASPPDPVLSPRRRGRPMKNAELDYFTPFCNRTQESKYNIVVQTLRSCDLLQIFQYLGMRDLAHCARVCRLWREMASTPALWRHVRMKNSHVSDWGGLCSALKRHGTRRLDLRKMLLPQNDATFWDQFADNIGSVDSLERIEMCRCPASAVEAVCRGLSGLRALSALAIRDALLDPAPLGALPLLHELRLKSMSGLSLTRDLRPLAALTQLQHLSLTSIKELGWCACDVIGQLEQLESLELGECTFRAEFAGVLARLRRLRRLRLERGTAQCAAPALLRALAALPLLTRLELVNVDVKVGFDDALAECKNIQRLLIIPTYVSQSATTNKQVLSGVLRLKDTLTHLMWGVTIELLRVTELFIDQCEQTGETPRRDVGECIPVLKPVPGCLPPHHHHHVAGPPQVEILPLPTLQRLLSAQLPNTKLKLLRIPFHATWRQSLADFQ